MKVIKSFFKIILLLSFVFASTVSFRRAKIIELSDKDDFSPQEELPFSGDKDVTRDTNTVTELIKKRGKMLFSAHRGAEGQAPYGSFPSYLLACEQGWDMIQIASARQSSDGTWYCLHDLTVDNQTNGTGYIAELSDSYIDSLHQDDGVDISSYSADEMRLPKLESVIKMAQKYGTLVSIRMGSLPGDIDSKENIDAWNSFIDLCEKYNPHTMMFSGTVMQLDILKSLTDNWHGQAYVPSGEVLEVVQYLRYDRNYSNCSILAPFATVSNSIIERIHDAGFLYVSTQLKNPVMEEFWDLHRAGCDIAQTGLSEINYLI